jgi:DnaJ-class molecular chaperone
MGAAPRIRNRMVMGTTGEARAAACPACRGQGWKFRRSRRALVIGTLIRGIADAARQSCLECGGSGQVPKLT